MKLTNERHKNIIFPNVKMVFGKRILELPDNFEVALLQNGLMHFSPNQMLTYFLSPCYLPLLT